METVPMVYMFNGINNSRLSMIILKLYSMVNAKKILAIIL